MTTNQKIVSAEGGALNKRCGWGGTCGEDVLPLLGGSNGPPLDEYAQQPTKRQCRLLGRRQRGGAIGEERMGGRYPLVLAEELCDKKICRGLSRPKFVVA